MSEITVEREKSPIRSITVQSAKDIHKELRITRCLGTRAFIFEIWDEEHMRERVIVNYCFADNFLEALSEFITQELGY